MSKLRLLIKRPGRADTYISVTVAGTYIIGNCISSLVDYLGLPRRDGRGRMLTYSLRLFSDPLLISKLWKYPKIVSI